MLEINVHMADVMHRPSTLGQCVHSLPYVNPIQRSLGSACRRYVGLSRYLKTGSLAGIWPILFKPIFVMAC